VWESDLSEKEDIDDWTIFSQFRKDRRLREEDGHDPPVDMFELAPPSQSADLTMMMMAGGDMATYREIRFHRRFVDTYREWVWKLIVQYQPYSPHKKDE
jgi:hypothetical protein